MLSYIIAAKRAQLTERGLLPRLQQTALPSHITDARPSMRTVRQAEPFLEQRPAIASNPFSLLFDVVLPSIQAVLLDRGEDHLKSVLNLLCDHGQAMTEKHGKERAFAHLEILFSKLPYHIDMIREEEGLQRLIEAYEKHDYRNDHADWADSIIKPFSTNIVTSNMDDHGYFHITMRIDSDDSTLEKLSLLGDRVASLNLALCGLITDAGLAYIRPLTSLHSLKLHDCRQITDEGIAHLGTHTALSFLMLDGSIKITDKGLTLLSRFPALKMLSLNGCVNISDVGLLIIKESGSLQHLSVNDCPQVTGHCLQEIKHLLPVDLETVDISELSMNTAQHNMSMPDDG